MALSLTLDPVALRKARLLAGFTQTALASIVDVHPITMTRYESGSVNPRPDTIKKLSAALGCQLSDIADVVDR